MNFEKCSEAGSKRNISVSENTRTFIIRNDNKRFINKVKVDGCLIDDNRPRCDYLFEIDKPMTLIIYVELKGKDIGHAFDQLIATMGYCKKRHDKLRKQCYIIASRVPKTGPGVQVLKKKMMKTYNTQLFVHTQKTEVTL